MNEFPLAKLKNEGGFVYPDDDGPRVEGNPLRPDLIGKGTTVGQLLGLLAAFPRDMRVMVRGYEGGFDDPEPLQIIKVQPDPYESSVYGNYENGDDKNPLAFSVVLIDR